VAEVRLHLSDHQTVQALEAALGVGGLRDINSLLRSRPINPDGGGPATRRTGRQVRGGRDDVMVMMMMVMMMIMMIMMMMMTTTMNTLPALGVGGLRDINSLLRSRPINPDGAGPATRRTGRQVGSEKRIVVMVMRRHG
jgi:hypothetical protein